MDKRIRLASLLVAGVMATSVAWAKLPPPPPLDEKGKAAAEEKKAKDAVAAEAAKKAQVDAEEKAVKNYQGNMKKAGKPIPKPTPIVAAAPAQIVPGPGAAKSAETPNKSGTTPSAPAVSMQGPEKGAMTPAGNTPPKGTDMPRDARK